MTHVDRQRRIEGDRSRRGLPDSLLDREAALHRGDRDVAERVMSEMQRHIGKQNQTRNKSNLPNIGCAHGARLRRRGTGWHGLRHLISPVRSKTFALGCRAADMASEILRPDVDRGFGAEAVEALLDPCVRVSAPGRMKMSEEAPFDVELG